jgi:hypothetical protein
MPPLGMHMTVARELAAELRSPLLLDEAGSFYLGATTPDIRVITKWDRADTHFFRLDDFSHQSGVQALLDQHPEVSSPSCLSSRSAAFMCGYITHLEMDEAWIDQIYRPCFGERSPLHGDVLANLLDRVLQFELDRRSREDRAAVSEIREALIRSTVETALTFLDEETLLRWRDVAVELLERDADWARFGSVASRHLRAYGVESEEDVAHFVANVADILDQATRAVTLERLEGFHAESRQRALAAVRAYLG